MADFSAALVQGLFHFGRMTAIQRALWSLALQLDGRRQRGGIGRAIAPRAPCHIEVGEGESNPDKRAVSL